MDDALKPLNNQLLNKIKSIPPLSGIYQYYDKDNKLLYVGKAKNLKNRVKSYFLFTPHLAPSHKLSHRINNMIIQVVSMDYIVVKSENDALILENTLIKQLKPKYNILLRDDKTYPYIYIDYHDEFPRFEITRRVISGNVEYFGPFSSGARDILDSIYEALPLVQKKSCVKGGKACLFYQIKRCLAPCEGKIDKDEYHKIVLEAKNLIKNKTLLVSYLQDKMQTLSQELRFEEATIMRDRIKSIKSSQIKTPLDLANSENIDIFVINFNELKGVVVKLFVRDGKVSDSDYTMFNYSNEFDLDEAYKRAIFSHYSKNILVYPSSILVSDEFEDMSELSSFISNKIGKQVNITKPKIGTKSKLVEIAYTNSLEHLKQQSTPISTLKEIQELFELDSTPYVVEAFDNSQMMGQATVGAMVVWENRWIKSNYRHYNLNSKDEYAQMKEMLINRTKSFEKSPPPDLWVIDGGKALLDLAIDILKSSGANVDVIAISKEKIDSKAHRAKGSAKDNIYYKDRVLKLSTNDKRLQFIQRLRDESHRFVIEYHRKQKRKEDKSISLLQIHGIGEAKVRKLLNYFGTFETIKNSSLSELEVVINSKDAQRIVEFFKN